MSPEQMLELVTGPLGQGAFGGFVALVVFAVVEQVVKSLRPKVKKTPTQIDDMALDAIEAGIKASKAILGRKK